MSAAAKTIIDSVGDLGRRFSDFEGTRPDYTAIYDGYGRLGLRPGAAVLILTPNTLEFVFHWIAIVANGLVPCAAAPSTRTPLIRAMQQSLGIGAVAGPRLEPARFEAIDHTRIGSFDVAVSDRDPSPYEPYDILALTTGTSGSQTACVHTVDSLACNAGMTNATLGIGSGDRQLVVLPMYHFYGLVTQSLGAILSGGEMKIDGPPFNARRFARLIGSEGITVCGITPTIARDLLARDTVLPPLRSLSIGGDRFAPEDIDRLLAKPFIDELYVTYGLTEAGPRVCVLPAHKAPREAFDSVGRPFAEVTTRIHDPGPDGVGQLLVKTPSVCRRKVGPSIARQPFTPDGYLETGDLFAKDAEGYHRYVARKSDILIVKGEKLNTRNIDQVAERHPDVEFARTSEGQPDSLITRLWAKEDKVLDLDQIKAFLRSSLRLHEVPDQLVQQGREVFHK